MYILKNWAIVVNSENAYFAPEQISAKLSGDVFDHPSFKDGSHIVSSRIVEANGRKIMTASNSIYILDGEPNADYVKWCQEHNYILNQENPITFKEKL